MKIPTYTNKARASNDAPGRPFGSRMNATPFIQAALAEGKVVGALSAEVGAYALQRQKMIANAEYNNNALAIEESIREATFDLSKSSDIGNIFQGGNLWQKRMDRIRKDVLGNIQNSNVQRKLDFSFNQSEIQSRFQLQTVVDRKIIAAEQAAIGARQAQAVADLSQVGASIEAYNAAMGQVAESQSGGVKDGRFSPAAVSTSNLKMRKDIASKYLANAYGDDINANFKMRKMLALQDEVVAGNMTSEKAVAALGFVDGYAAHVLLSIPRGDALEIIKGNLKNAMAFYDVNQKIESDLIRQDSQINDDAYNLAFSNDRIILKTRLEDVGLPQRILETLPTSTEGFVSSIDAKEAIFDYLRNKNALTPDRRTALEDEIAATLSPDTALDFPDQSDQSVKADLNLLANSGKLNVVLLNQNKRSLSGSDYNMLLNKIFTKSNESLNDFLRVVRAKYSYSEELAANDDDLSRASRAAYDAVSGSLALFAFNNPQATADAVKQEGNRLMDDQEAVYQAAQREEFLSYLAATTTKIAGKTIQISEATPVADIQAFIDSTELSAVQVSVLKGRQRTIAKRFRGMF